MAILKDWAIGNTLLTAAGAYHRIVGFGVTLLPSPALTVTVATYASQAARTANADVLTLSTVTVSGAPAAAFVGMTQWKTLVGRLYTLVVKPDPQWAGGTDAADPAE